MYILNHSARNPPGGKSLKFRRVTPTQLRIMRILSPLPPSPSPASHFGSYALPGTLLFSPAPTPWTSHPLSPSTHPKPPPLSPHPPTPSQGTQQPQPIARPRLSSAPTGRAEGVIHEEGVAKGRGS